MLAKDTAPIDPETGLKWFTGWGGQKRYYCPEPGCAYDDYDPVELMETHYKGSHAIEEQIVDTKLFDANSKPIKRKIHVPK